MNEHIFKMKNFNLKGQRTEKLFNLKVRKNSVHSILFQNEAEKNRLLKFLKGEVDFKEAEIFLNDKLFNRKELQEAGRETIYFINQYSAVNPKKDPLGIFKFNKQGEEKNKSTVFPEMTVAENIFFGREPLKKFLFFKSIDNQKMIEQTAELLKLIDLELYPTQKMLELTSLEKQLVELLKAVSFEAELIVIDQAVVELKKEDKAVFFNFMQQLKKKEFTIIYFTREIDEVFASSDHVTILKDGKNKETKKVSESEHNELAILLMGR